MITAIKILKVGMSFIYAIFKLVPIKKGKVLFLSRQSDTKTLDFAMLEDEMRVEQPNIKVVAICNRLDDKLKGLIGFAIDMVRSMYHLATSEVCVLDAYWPAVSMLKHKESLTVIQMWHAMGKIKKSGYQTLGKDSGRNRDIAEVMCMHKNYDIVIGGGEAWNQYYCESFNIKEDVILNIGLPRTDYLINTEKNNHDKILMTYPEFKDKKVILYAPTFRRGIELKWEPLLDEIDFDKYILIIKGHPNQKIDCSHEGVKMCKEYSAIELLSVCDYLITDYSAIAVEAAILNKKTYYYLYDYDEYTSKNGINVSPFDSMPGLAFDNAKELMKDLNMGEYKDEVFQNYRQKYLPKELGTSTKKLCQIVLSHCFGSY